MNRAQPLLLLLVLAAPALFAQPIDRAPFVLGEVRQLYSEALHEVRTLNIYLPAGYSRDSARHYPVIYLLDGSADEDFIHVVGLVQFATFPWVNTLPASIVVGIANVDRKRDFTFPSRNAEDQAQVPSAGGSAAFIRFIETELQPFINRHYPTDTTATLIGQSLGGLLATEILFKKPDLFTHYILVSPSLWWDDESLLRLEPQRPAKPITVYLTVGREEHPVMVRTAVALSEQLQPGKAGQGRLFFKQWEGHDHGSILHWAVYDAFGQIFRAKQ